MSDDALSESGESAESRTEPAIKVQRLNKSLGGKVILDQVNFQIAQGQICGLLGPNGAGKTTLLRCLCSSLNADFGRCLISGRDSSNDPLVYNEFGFSPDFPCQEPDLRVNEYLQLHARIRGIASADIAARIHKVLTLVHLCEQEYLLVGSLSRGQGSRLALAEALLHQPAVIILDEPTAGLDPAQVHNQRQLLQSLAGNHTILVATHNLAEAQAICDQLVILVAGRIRFQGTPQELAADGDIEHAYLELVG